jgi:H+/Cl- antiporter ClcA
MAGNRYEQSFYRYSEGADFGTLTAIMNMSEFQFWRKPAARSFVLAILVIGVATGFAGMGLALLLHWIQHLAYGYSLDHIISNETFLQGVSAASPQRRLLAMTACGLVAGCGWWAVYRFGRPLVSIKKAVAAEDPSMPLGSTLAHALLQIITVALGSPLGREVAPREVGATLAGWWTRHSPLDSRQRRILMACGAGAGLAAVYNVPLAGAVFVMEVLLGSFEWSVAIPALATSTLAAVVAWLGLGNEHQYTVPALQISLPLVAWAIICGPLFGMAAFGFGELTKWARAHAPRGNTLPLWGLVNFFVIGLIAIYFPQIPGNGKGAVALAFDQELGIALAAILLVLKVLSTVASLRAGAEGGLLTPGLANGALLAVVLGGIWNLFWPGTSLGAYAIVGATAFLASSMQMPITAVLLTLEFTRIDHDFLIPMLLAVAGSIAACRLLGWLQAQGRA